MCDSFVVLPGLSASGAMLFAKNSDRERNEAQALDFVPAARHRPGAAHRLTYIEIAQVARTHACLISRPCWMWGAEMGVNEHGVAIGNEAMHARVAPQEAPALTGMDLLRLALERAESAAKAVEIITHLLETHGQGGDCGHRTPFFYHNGFLIADGHEAFVLETVGRWWACERVAGSRALSNAYSIGRGYDKASAALAVHARAEGWLDREGRFDFAERMLDPARDAESFGRGRCARGAALLEAGAGRHTSRSMMAVLRDHGPEGAQDDWTPEQTLRRSICMHAAEGARRSQTTASMVTEWRDETALNWVTASAAPCLGLFKPIVFAMTPPDAEGALCDQYDAAKRWWRHERLHRAALRDYARAIARIAPERDALEARFVERMQDAPHDRLAESAALCWREADEAEARWEAALAALPDARRGTAYKQSWDELDRIAAMP